MTDDNRFLAAAVPGVRALRPYEPGKPISELERELGITDIIKLASNENPLGPSPAALAALRDALADIALYPDGNGFALKAALAEKHGVSPAQLTLGSGSDHIIELVSRAFLRTGRNAVISRHAFAIYAITAQAAGAELHVADAHPADHADMPYGHDLDAMASLVDADTGVLFIANPNNPTGTWCDRDALSALLRRVRDDLIVVVDEAYFDYVEEARYPDAMQLVGTHPNLVVLRTFSKAYGLAGLRVGYAVSSTDITDLLNRVRLSFNPSSLAQAGALAALRDTDHIERTVELNRTELRRMDEGLTALGLATIPSVCNFVTVDVGRPGREVFQQLLEQGVIVRPLDAYGLPQHLRISVGLPEQNDRLLAALGDILA
jgi:histidinol-phosphate aminotransferase